MAERIAPLARPKWSDSHHRAGTSGAIRSSAIAHKGGALCGLSSLPNLAFAPGTQPPPGLGFPTMPCGLPAPTQDGEWRSREALGTTPERRPRCRGPARVPPKSIGRQRAGETGSGPNISTHAVPVQHSCRPTSAPLLNRSHSSLFLSLLSSVRMWGTPRGPIPQPDRSPPLIRDFRPLIPAHDGGRLPSRLDG